MNNHLQKIDVHHHFMFPEYSQTMMKASKGREFLDVIRATGISNVREMIGKIALKWNPDFVLEWMERNHVETVIGSHPGQVFLDHKRFFPDLATRCNDHLARIIQDHPHRFGGFAMLPLPDVSLSLKEMEYVLDTLHLDGVVMVASTNGVYLGSPEQSELFSELNRRNAVVFIHPFVKPGMDIPLSNLHIPPYLIEYVIETTRAVTSLLYSGTLEKNPNIKFILPHAGGTIPYLVSRLALGELVPGLRKRVPQGVKTYLQNLYYDTALSTTPHALKSLQEIADSSHILFGSDYPPASEETSIESINGLNIYSDFSDADRSLIFRENALKLFPRLNR